MPSCANILRCAHCLHSITFDLHTATCQCLQPRYEYSQGIYEKLSLRNATNGEIHARDRQALTYLSHGKFPTQIASVARWLGRQSTTGVESAPSLPLALDLGCGPGPYSKMLEEAGYAVLGVDFSSQSLRINAGTTNHAVYVQEDLNEVRFEPSSVDLVLMADFLQHLGGREQRRRFLTTVFEAMKPGAPFYLSFFNVNLKNYLRGDIHGSFSNGDIAYERLTLENVLNDLPTGLAVSGAFPMNVFHKTALDAVMKRLPLARHFARMMVIEGQKDASVDAPVRVPPRG